MRPGDLAQASGLSAAARWNQTEADWRRVLDYAPAGCFVALVDDRVVGSVTTTGYASALAWIGMMLVHPAHRGRGIARALMTRALQHLESCGFAAIALDATPMGRPLYEQLGFVPLWTWHRWGRPLGPPSRTPPPNGDGDPSPYWELDFRAFGADRSDWLTRLARSSRIAAGRAGLAMMRPGALAWQLGPVVAESATEAGGLIDQLLSTVGPGECVWDVPEVNSAATELARQRGFEQQRPLARMVRGEPVRRPDVELQYAIGDPATG